MEKTKKECPLSNLSVGDALRRVVMGLESDSDDNNTDDDSLSSDEEENLEDLSNPQSDVEQDADSDDHAAVRVPEQDGEFALPRARGEEEVVLATLVVQIDGDVNLRVFVALLVLLMLRIEVHFAV